MINDCGFLTGTLILGAAKHVLSKMRVIETRRKMAVSRIVGSIYLHAMVKLVSGSRNIIFHLEKLTVALKDE